MGICRTDIINHLIKVTNAKTYLEVGIREPWVNFDKIVVDEKYGVDIKVVEPRMNVVEMTSDEYFARCTRKFDVIFIDGDHRFDLVMKDVLNATKFITDNGIVIMHDMCPQKEEYQVPEKPSPDAAWYGEAWKVFATLRMTEPGLFMVSIQDDCGCGVIMKGHQKLFPVNELTWDFLVENRKDILNQVFTLDDLGKSIERAMA